jgi:hypothetical protein
LQAADPAFSSASRSRTLPWRPSSSTCSASGSTSFPSRAGARSPRRCCLQTGCARSLRGSNIGRGATMEARRPSLQISSLDCLISSRSRRSCGSGHQQTRRKPRMLQCCGYGGGGGMSAQASQWCGSVFTRRAGGGKAQRFCSPKCRRAMDSAARAWVRNEMARGRLTVFQLQRARCPEPDPEAAWPGGWIAGSGDRCPF